MPEDLVRQIEPLHELVRAHGWPLLMVEGVEADDVIGTLATQAAAAGIDCVISTSDKDLAQLVRPGITLVNTMSNETLDEAGVVAKFGVRADQVLDLLALTGDAVDNVPGVAKVGPKTAAKWLAQYGTLDAVIAHAGEIPGVVGDNLRATLDWLPQGKRLLTVKTDCALPLSPTDLRFGPADARPVAAALRALRVQELAARRQGPRFGGDGAAAIADRAARQNRGISPMRVCATRNAAGDPPPAVPRHYETVLDDAALRALAERDRARGARLLRHRDDRARPDARADRRAVLRDRAGPRLLHPARASLSGRRRISCRSTRTLARLARWFADPARKKLGQNVKYDQHVLANHGLPLDGVAHDTLLESYVLEAHRPHDMDNLAWRHLNVRTIAYAEVAGKGAKQIGFDQVSIADATAYSAEDADITLQLHRSLHPRVAADPKLDHVYTTIEMPVRQILFEMEREGVMLDTALLAAQSAELGAQGDGTGGAGLRLAGQPFNLASPKQLGEILFDKMKLPTLRKTATGQPSTDEEVLTELAADYPLPKVLLEHRSLSKLKSTYTDKLPQMVNPRTGRVHTTFSQATAVTGRLASSDPNLQNIPVRTAEGRRIREAFIAPPGQVIVSADYSQIELRIMAHLSGDPALVKAFREGADIHRATAADIFGVPGRQGDDRPAALHQGGELRADLRHGRVRTGAAARHRARRGAAVHRPVLPAVPGRGGVHAGDARIRAGARLCRDGVRAAAVAARHQGRGRAASRRRGACRDQRADAGHCGRPGQARDDRGARLDPEREGSQRSSCCRCTTSWCSRFRKPSWPS